jgi:hypothetical protein
VLGKFHAPVDAVDRVGAEKAEVFFLNAGEGHGYSPATAGAEV